MTVAAIRVAGRPVACSRRKRKRIDSETNASTIATTIDSATSIGS